MKLSIAENFLFLAINPKSLSYSSVGTQLNSGLIGALIMDLINANILALEGKNLVISNKKTDLVGAEAVFYKYISAAKRPRSLKSWISRINSMPAKIRNPLLQSLQDKRLIRIKKKRFLFIPYKKISSLDKIQQHEMILSLRSDIVKPIGFEIEHDRFMLLSLIYACKMERIIARNRKEARDLRYKLKVLSASNPVSVAVNAVMKEMQMAIVAAVSISAVSAASH